MSGSATAEMAIIVPPISEAPSLSVGLTTCSMAFLTGCGRSGTTILGKMLARHPDIALLNDRFDLWVIPFPITDVWGRSTAADHQPRIAMDHSDARAAGPAARAAFLAGMEQARAGKPMLVEKLAINNFRLPFVAELYPGARFINILRHGVEVARSIAERAAAGKWYGRDGVKWDALVSHAKGQGLAGLLDLCTTPYARGLLEWRLSVEAAEGFRAQRPDLPWLALRYEQLLVDPVAVSRSLTDFLGLARSPVMERFAATQIRRRSPAADEGDVPLHTRTIAGEVLERLGYGSAREAHE
jgi:hypothetical protein